MKSNAMERLNELVLKKGVLLAGLDPDMDKILEIYKKTQKFSEVNFESDQAFLEAVMMDYCFDYIEAIEDEVAAIKINIAFFESCAMQKLFFDIAEIAQLAGLFVIADVKRADIGNTSKKYAETYLYKDSPIDAITINPYFGTDGVKPFLDLAKENEKGVFVLVKTSNPSSSEIQNLELKNGIKVYQHVAELVKEWGEYAQTNEKDKYSLVGAVVGATHPEEAKILRAMMPNTFFLVPGYGAQGATAKDVVVNFDNIGGGAIVNSSRGLMFAYEKQKLPASQWQEATKKAVRAANDELTRTVDSVKGFTV